MENKDLGSKKINNEQQINEGFSGENIPNNYDPSKSKMNPEIEVDKDGKTKIVDRARNTDKNSKISDSKDSKDLNKNENYKNRGVETEKEVIKTVENKDFNSDIVPNRHPNSNPDNKGNIKYKSD